MHEKLYAMIQAYQITEKQMQNHRIRTQRNVGRDTYEAWYKIELAIRKFDRIFNKVEKYDARKFNDPENHERREKRMLERKRKRQVENFTYFFGGNTEEEQQYMDYFETDIEEDPEDDHINELSDKLDLASTGIFDHKLYDFVDT